MVFTYRELWRWLIENGIPKNNIGEQPTRVLINICKLKKTRVDEQEAKGGYTNKTS